MIGVFDDRCISVKFLVENVRSEGLKFSYPEVFSVFVRFVFVIACVVKS